MMKSSQLRNYINLGTIFKAFAHLLFMLLPASLTVITMLNLVPLYYHLLDKFNVYSNFGFPQPAVDRQFAEALDYINLRSNDLDYSFFSQEDIWHLTDVRALSLGAYVTLLLCTVAVIWLYRNPKQLNELHLKRLAITLSILVSILVSWFIIDFDRAFIAFHKLAFNNPYWLLDPATSNLIKYFPPGVFNWILLIGLILCVFLYLIFYLAFKYRRSVLATTATSSPQSRAIP